jgi:hypothetical protein
MKMETEFYQDVGKFKSRRRYFLELKKRFGEWFLLKSDPPLSEEKKQEAFRWCTDLKSAWGCDETKRRFYFANKDDAMRFKLTFGGKL